MVRTGTMKIPLAMPSTPPSMLVPSATANNHNSRPIGTSLALAQENRTARLHSKRARHRAMRGDGREPILCLEQRRGVFLFQQRKDRLILQIIGHDLLPQFLRQVGFVE